MAYLSQWRKRTAKVLALAEESSDSEEGKNVSFNEHDDGFMFAASTSREQATFSEGEEEVYCSLPCVGKPHARLL